MEERHRTKQVRKIDILIEVIYIELATTKNA